MTSIRLRTGAWYSDGLIDLTFPKGWEVDVWWPRTPGPMTSQDIIAALEAPTNQPPIKTLCIGKKRPLLIVDDLNRPTPVCTIMPFLLAKFKDAGLSPNCITILIASGMHAPPVRESLVRKLGPEAVSSCRVVVHDYSRGLAKLGKTRLGTPIEVNSEVVRSDFILGIGGIYPNHTAGFGGGSKLALGVLGAKTIAHLHSHPGAGWGSGGQSKLRQEMDEIARILHLNSMISMQVDADRRLVKMDCGDHFAYFQKVVEFCRTTYTAPQPHDTNWVVSNAYPNDLSLTFARMKGMAPLQRWAPAGASRVAIAGCVEGLGRHNLFPLAQFPDPVWLRAKARQLCARRLGNIGKRLVRKVAQRFEPVKAAPTPKLPIMVYCTSDPAGSLPDSVSNMNIFRSWEHIVKSVQREQEGAARLKVTIYPCAPLQILS